MYDHHDNLKAVNRCCLDSGWIKVVLAPVLAPKDPRQAKDRCRGSIRRMLNENPSWGAPRIHGELLKLGFGVSERTVSRYRSATEGRRQAPDTVLCKRRNSIWRVAPSLHSPTT